MRNLGWLAVLVAALAPRPASAQDARTVRVETVNGSQVTGKIALKSIRIRSDVGDLEVDGKKIRSIKYENRVGYEGQAVAILQTITGSIVVGTIEMPEFRIESELGTLNIAQSKVRSISFEDPPPDREPGAPKSSGEASAEEKQAGRERTAPSTWRPVRQQPIPRSLLEPGRGRASKLPARTGSKSEDPRSDASPKSSYDAIKLSSG